MKTNILKKPAVVGILAFVCCVLWGSAIPTIKTGYSLMGIPGDDTAAQILYAGSRFAMAGILALIMGSILNRRVLKPSKNILRLSFKLSLVQTVGQYVFFYIGVAHTSGVKGSIITATSTFFAILIASLVFKQEKLTANKIMGCLMGFAGVVLINVMGNHVDMGFKLLGEGFMVVSALAYAMSSVLIRDFSQKEDPVTLSGYQFFIGGVIMCMIGLAFGGRLEVITAQSVSILMYLAMVSAVAYSLWSVLLKHNPVSRISVYGFMNPMCGVVLSAIILGESQQAFNLGSLAALVLVCTGIYIVNRPKANEDLPKAVESGEIQKN